jgi:hypothetical protein
MAVGAITEADHVNSIISAGRADLCAVARPHLANAAWTLQEAARIGYTRSEGLAWPPQYQSGKPQLEALFQRAQHRLSDAVVPFQNAAGNQGFAGGGDDGISIKENNFSVPGFQPPPVQKSSRRPDMKGPGDITDILSGLKTKTINISEAPQRGNDESFADNNSSTISVNDLKEIQTDANVPKRSKRKPRSDKNTVSLDI